MQSTGMPEETKLPGGLVLDDRHRLESAELRPLTGRDEEWIAAHPTAPSAIAVTRILTSCLVRIGEAKPTEKLVRRLLVGDRDFLVLQLRRLTLGDEFHVVFSCTACGNKMDVAIRCGHRAGDGSTPDQSRIFDPAPFHR